MKAELPKPFPYKALSLDVDGTLYSLPRFKRSVFFKNFLDVIHWLAMEKVRKSVRKDAPSDVRQEIVARLARELRKTPEQADELERRLVYEEWPRLLRHVGAYAGVFEALDQVPRDIALAAFSDYPSRHKLEALGLHALPWQAVVDAMEEGSLKPGRAGYLAVADRLGLQPAEILHVGDSLELDVLGAIGAGMHVCLVGQPKSKYWEMFPEAKPTYWFRSPEAFFAALPKSVPQR